MFDRVFGMAGGPLRRALVAAAGAVLLTSAAPEPAGAQPGPSRVVVSPAEAREIRTEAPIIGSLVATVDSAVATSAGGVVLEAPYKVGDIIEEGDMIARVDPERYEIDVRAATAAVAQAEAALAVAQARRASADDELARAEGLRGSAAFSTARVEDLNHAAAEAASAVAEAEAALANAEAELARAEYFLGRTVIIAPFGGVVTERMAEPGQYIAVGEAAARVVSLDELEVEVDAPVDRIEAVQLGAEVRVMFGDVAAPGVVRAVVPQEAASTRTRPVRITVDFSDVNPVYLAPGATVTVMAPTAPPRTAVLAPKDALVQGPRGWIVYVAVDGQAQPRLVALGASVGDDIELMSGVAPGDLVVIRGNEGLRPGAPIQPMPAGEPPASGGGAAPGAPVEQDGGAATEGADPSET